MNEPNVPLEPISARYRETIKRMLGLSVGSPEIDKGHVYLEANLAIRALIDPILQENLAEGSELRHADRLFALHRLAGKGKSVLILSEHYSNADLPALIYFLSGWAAKAGPRPKTSWPWPASSSMRRTC